MDDPRLQSADEPLTVGVRHPPVIAGERCSNVMSSFSLHIFDFLCLFISGLLSIIIFDVGVWVCVCVCVCVCVWVCV